MKKIIKTLSVIFIMIILSSCTTLPKNKENLCGDGFCDSIEKNNPRLCPDDCAEAATNRSADDNASEKIGITSDSPYYFIAIHNEPAEFDPSQEKAITTAFNILKRMIKKADEYDIKLTLMFSAPWADFILGDEDRAKELENWKKSGHEISAHHHGVRHVNWDGYTNYSESYVLNEVRKDMKVKYPEKYIGTLDDLTKELQKLNPGINSGCLNEEYDKAEIPDNFVYMTCSGYPNTEDENDVSKKGLNDFVLSGEWAGKERKWISHTLLSSKERVSLAKNVFSGAKPNEVYGTVFHSFFIEEEFFMEWLEFLHSRDGKGAKSVTVTQAIEQNILDDKNFEVPQFKGTTTEKIKTPIGKCGDGVCGDLEIRDPYLCPSDCK